MNLLGVLEGLLFAVGDEGMTLNTLSDILEVSKDEVGLGSTVSLKYVDDDEEDEYKIVGSQEADPFESKISNESPIAQAILKHKVGDIVTVESPNGSYDVEITEITLIDILGIREIKLKCNESAECLVAPQSMERNKEAGQIYLRGVTEAMESKEKGYDFSDVSGIREYIPGDKLQNIHWKLSVKKDELMVKERVNLSATQLNVLVDLANNEDMCAEGVLELADSITKAFVLQNLPFTVHYYSTNTGEIRGCYISNEIERKQWVEMVLYDRCYSGDINMEDMFMMQNPLTGNYLYIGLLNGTETDDSAILGDKMTGAFLKQQ